MAPRKLDNEALRTRVLDLVRAGHGMYEAARISNINPTTLRAYVKFSPEFSKMLDDAKLQSVEPVFAMLRKRAIQDEDVTAAKEYLRHTSPPPPETHLHLLADEPQSLDSPEIQDVNTFTALARERRGLPSPEVIEVNESE